MIQRDHVDQVAVDRLVDTHQVHPDRAQARQQVQVADGTVGPDHCVAESALDQAQKQLLAAKGPAVGVMLEQGQGPVAPRHLIEALRKDPGSLSLALSSALGGTHHISFGMPLLSGKVDIKKTRMVAFNSTGEAVTALLGGHVDVLSGGTVQIAPHVASGKMRLLAVSAAHRLPGALASGPTWPELGYKGVFENWRGVIGTKGITAPQVAYWDNVFGTIARSDEFKTLAQKNQWEINYKNSAETRKFLEGEYTELKEVMDFLGLSK